MIATYLIYGAAFFFFGTSVLLQTRYDLQSVLGKSLWILGIFGVVHGISEWLCMFLLIYGANSALGGLSAAATLFKVASFPLLAIYGFRSTAELKNYPDRWAYGITALLILLAPIHYAVNVYLVGPAPWSDVVPLSRLYLMIPGAIAAGVGFFSIARSLGSTQLPKFYSRALGCSFFAYAIFAGLFVEPGSCFPTNWINSDFFFRVFGFQVHIARAACAASSATFVTLILTRFADSLNSSLLLRVKEQTAELKKKNDLLVEQQSFIVNASKMSALGEMAGGIAHEINNPISIIQIRADQLTEACEDGDLTPSMVKANAQTISRTAFRIATIVQGLRSFSRDGSKDPLQTITMATVINETLVFCQEKFKNGNVRLEVHCEPTLEVNCRPTQISQVVLNLVSNAFDAIELLQEKWVRIEVKAGADHAEISITDSGAGIPKEVQDKIMQPFFSTKPVGKGTGLGLSISKGIIQSHGGDLLLDSACANTRFFFRLPCSRIAQGDLRAGKRVG